MGYGSFLGPMLAKKVVSKISRMKVLLVYYILFKVSKFCLLLHFYFLKSAIV